MTGWRVSVGLLLLCAATSHAHLLNMTRITLVVDETAEAELTMVIDLGQSLLTPESYWDLAKTPPELQQARLRPVIQQLEAGVQLVGNGKLLPLSWQQAAFEAASLDAVRNPLTPQMATLRWRFPASQLETLEVQLAPAFAIPWPCFVRLDSHRRPLPVSRVLSAGHRSTGRLALHDGGDATQGDGSTVDTVGVYTLLGFQHIVPLGLDHVAFILGLFLLGGRWSQLLALVSCFTVAHTVTLGVSTLGIATLPAAVVEPLIAVSIVYVAAEVLFGRGAASLRLSVVFLFGLLHGFGFASVLGDLGLPANQFVLALLSFNIGVELGQLAVLLAAFLSLGLFRNRSWYGPCMAQPAAVLIAGLGCYWLLERVVGMTTAA